MVLVNLYVAFLWTQYFATCHLLLQITTRENFQTRRYTAELLATSLFIRPSSPSCASLPFTQLYRIGDFRVPTLLNRYNLILHRLPPPQTVLLWATAPWSPTATAAATTRRRTALSSASLLSPPPALPTQRPSSSPQRKPWTP